MNLIPSLHCLCTLLMFVLIDGKDQNTIQVNFTNSSMKSIIAAANFENVLTSKANAKSSSSKCSHSLSAGKGSTTLRPVVERIFSRKKRFLLAPAKTRFKFTLQMSKKLLANYPTGFNFNIELAVYYPMITSRLDLIPKRLRPKTTPKPKANGPTPPLIVQIPGSLIRYKAKPAAKPAKVQRIDESGQQLQWVGAKPAAPTSAAAQYYTQPLKWQQWSKYGAPGYAQRYEWTPAKQWPEKQPTWLSQDSKWSKWTTTPLPWVAPKEKWQQKASKWQQWDNNAWTQNARWQRDTRSIEDIENMEPAAPAEILEELEEIEPLYAHFPELEDHHEWKHYHSYRDRRQLYHQLHGLSDILGIDLKSCVLRVICDCKRFLLPPGYSMVQDILRKLFTFPTKIGLEDEFSRIVKQNYETCDAQLRTACPFNILAWLMGQKQG
ncbi:uncharacterized protein LOC128868652 [Anastrepha ludens]|uniref:uncharacterized protein LOC128868652 n=1 Tax=Anastrepha ludens TaxID=28586 RepID=UPI0023B1A1D4|nr:uncharacterized protein LOC128868652 [Anastrepha ludens]